MFYIILSICLHIAFAQYPSNEISIYGDVHKDKEFFTKTLPWIVDNIGGDLDIEFYMVGSGRYGVPQMCALQMLSGNTYLQAQYLKCEAEGKLSEFCLCETGINPEEFKCCVAKSGYLSSVAAFKFNELRVDITPIVEIMPGSTVFSVEDTWFLKKICTIFGDTMPRGCVKPFECNGTIADFDESNARAIAHFDGSCKDQQQHSSNNEPSTTKELLIENSAVVGPLP